MTDESVPPVTEPPNEKGSMLWLKVLAGLVAGLVGLIAVVVFVVTAATSGAASASDEFVDHILTNQASNAYAMFSAEAQAQVPEDEFVAAVDQISSVLDDTADQTSKSVAKSGGSNTTGVVTYEVNGSDGEYTFTVNLVKDGDDWRVRNFDSSKKRE